MLSKQKTGSSAEYRYSKYRQYLGSKIQEGKKLLSKEKKLYWLQLDTPLYRQPSQHCKHPAYLNTENKNALPEALIAFKDDLRAQLEEKKVTEFPL